MSSITIKPPYEKDLSKYKKIFLAGSIEQNMAIRWQDKVVNDLSGHNIIFLNPRRDEWDSSWDHSTKEGSMFCEQVKWELEGIDESDIVIFYFDPSTKSPITMLELGYVLGKKMKTVVYCPEEFYRHGNVVITSRRNGVEVHTEYNSFINNIEELILTD